jgi:hypothetical protein
MEKLLQIFIFFFKNFFNGYINSFIHINQHIVFKFILSVYEISKNFQSLIKKQFNFLIIFFFRNNFFPSLLNYNKRIYPIFNNNKSRGHSLINILIKFFKKTDVLLLIMTFFYLFFIKNMNNYSFYWINNQIIKNLKKQPKKYEIIFYKYLVNLKNILKNMNK